MNISDFLNSSFTSSLEEASNEAKRIANERHEECMNFLVQICDSLNEIKGILKNGTTK